VLADPETDLKAATTTLAALPAVVAGDPAGESQNKVSWSSKREIRLSGLVSAQTPMRMPMTNDAALRFAMSGDCCLLIRRVCRRTNGAFAVLE
jgi:hypothetical protein